MQLSTIHSKQSQNGSQMLQKSQRSSTRTGLKRERERMNQETGNSAAIKRDKAKMQQQGYWFISDVFPTLHRSNRGKSNQHTTPHTGYCNRIQIKPLGKKKTTNPPSPSGIEGRKGGGGGEWALTRCRRGR